jgi:hypothetical protein
MIVLNSEIVTCVKVDFYKITRIPRVKQVNFENFFEEVWYTYTFLKHEETIGKNIFFNS